ncbi:MAG: NfeD family protein [Phascolarctobacterium faecium]
MPGFGFFGVTGLISLLAGSYYLLGGGAEAAYILLGVVLALGAVVALLFVYLPAESKWNPFFYGETRTVTVIQVPRITRSILVNVERSVAPLRPAGTVIIDGERVDVVSFGDYIMPGALVEIVKVEGNKLFVQEVKTN